MSEKKSGTQSGVNFLGLLAILFIGLKLTGNIDWSWLWVLSPLWCTIPIVVLALLLAFIIAMVKK